VQGGAEPRRHQLDEAQRQRHGARGREADQPLRTGRIPASFMGEDAVRANPECLFRNCIDSCYVSLCQDDPRPLRCGGTIS
jgi:hypothetical protein